MVLPLEILCRCRDYAGNPQLFEISLPHGIVGTSRVTAPQLSSRGNENIVGSCRLSDVGVFVPLLLTTRLPDKSSFMNLCLNKLIIGRKHDYRKQDARSGVPRPL
jgi:hypothetical protein